MATRGSVIEVMPGMYQRANFLSWPYRQKEEVLRRYGITVVFNLWNKVDPDLSGQVLYVNWPIRGNAMPEHADLMVDFAASLLVSGEQILIHCEAGVNRSAWFCAAVMAKARGITYDQAVEKVKMRIPRAHPHQAFTPEGAEA